MIGDNMSKETFKGFVRNHPNLVSYVNRGEMTWQKFYEMYDMYGENSVIWDPYQLQEKRKAENTNQASASSVNETATFKDLLQFVKHMDLETVRRGVDGVQKAIGLVQELSNHKPVPEKRYEPRPMYKYFED